MERYLSHFSAADFWDIPYLSEVIEKKAGEKEILHLTFANSKNGWQRKGIISHTSSLPLPPSAIVSKKGIKVASPELVFLQLANSLSTIQLYDEGACEDFAYNLAARIGKRLQIRTEKFRPMHTKLRGLLPR